MSEEKFGGYDPGAIDLSAAYESATSERAYLEIFHVYDNQYDSRFSTAGQSKPHNWHATGATQLTYQDRNGKKTFGICAGVAGMNHGQGCITFGPYENLSHGNYRADFEMCGAFDGSVTPDTIVAHIDLCVDIGKQVLVSQPIRRGDFDGLMRTFTLRVSNRTGFRNLEARIYFCGIGGVGYKKIVFAQE